MQNNSSCNSIWYDYGRHEGLNTVKTYVIEGVKANLCLFTNSLQVIFRITDDGYRERKSQYILQNYKINSREYRRFIDYLYSGNQNGVFEMDVNDVHIFCYYGKLKYVNDHYEIDFNSLDPIATAVSKLYRELYQD